MLRAARRLLKLLATRGRLPGRRLSAVATCKEAGSEPQDWVIANEDRLAGDGRPIGSVQPVARGNMAGLISANSRDCSAGIVSPRGWYDRETGKVRWETSAVAVPHWIYETRRISYGRRSWIRSGRPAVVDPTVR